MSRSQIRKITLGLTIGVFGFGVVSWMLSNPSETLARADLKIDVSCDANRFVFQGPSTAAGPGYGASFVVQGVIYPEGTFADYGSASGLLANGDPEFPELVLGEWTCRGWFIGDGFATTTGPFVTTTQIYNLSEIPGKSTLVSDGLELIDLDVAIRRAVTGGTGRFKRARGEVFQKAVGANATGLFNFTFEFDI